MCGCPPCKCQKFVNSPFKLLLHTTLAFRLFFSKLINVKLCYFGCSLFFFGGVRGDSFCTKIREEMLFSYLIQRHYCQHVLSSEKLSLKVMSIRSMLQVWRTDVGSEEGSRKEVGYRDCGAFKKKLWETDRRTDGLIGKLHFQYGDHWNQDSLFLIRKKEKEFQRYLMHIILVRKKRNEWFKRYSRISKLFWIVCIGYIG